MKTRTILLGVLGFSMPALAAPPDVSILTQASGVVDQCAAIAREIDAMQVPAGHANANLRAATLKVAGLKEMPSAATVAPPTPPAAPANPNRDSKASGPASGRAGAADAEAKAKADADAAKAAADMQIKAQADAAVKEQAMQDAFEATMLAAVARFESCGKNYADVVPKANAKLKEITEGSVSEADAKAVAPTADKYVASTKAFAASATRLSRDRQVQSYVAQTLATYYFK